MRRVLLLIGLLLGGCVTDTEMVYRRIDGQPVTGSPQLTSTFEIDSTICKGEMAKADAASVAPAVRRLQADEDVMNGCMAQKGYRLAPKN